jgi:hypothetical protein
VAVFDPIISGKVGRGFRRNQRVVKRKHVFDERHGDSLELSAVIFKCKQKFPLDGSVSVIELLYVKFVKNTDSKTFEASTVDLCVLDTVSVPNFADLSKVDTIGVSLVFALNHI